MSRQAKTVTNGNGIVITTTMSDITVDKIYVADYQKEGTLTAQLRQTVHTVSKYPAKKVASSMQDNLFAVEDFGFDSTDFENKEERVAWIPVPVGTTEEQLKAKIEAANGAGAVIYKVLSNHPILDENQRYAINNPALEATMDTFANSQVVRYPVGHDQEGQLCLDSNQKVQYRRTFFRAVPFEDQDARSTSPADVYMSPEIIEELQGAGAVSQTQVI